ncbi:GNAT family N-acetyltransferase [Leuconostocaceae bacterium ESL0723]|nr:GNAT family N-acetyltransferase [Leuconostocaceae bacterium ESL0723]
MIVKTYAELSKDELYQILRLRCQVFIVEQEQFYQDDDNQDQDALHVFESEGDKVVAYARIYRLENGQVAFGRVATAESVRGHGLGKQLLNQVMATIGQVYPGQPIEIEAQLPVVKLYERYGFTTEGEPFDLDGLDHIKMVHPGTQKASS